MFSTTSIRGGIIKVTLKFLFIILKISNFIKQAQYQNVEGNHKTLMQGMKLKYKLKISVKSIFFKKRSKKSVKIKVKIPKFFNISLNNFLRPKAI